MTERERSPIVPDDFAVPTELACDGFRLEPLGPRHNERDHAAWMGSIDYIRSLPGFDGGGDWPEAMSLEDNLSDLEMHERHFRERVGFTYSVLVADEVVGCVYIYPTDDASHDVAVRSWTTAAHAGLHPALLTELCRWMDAAWPFDGVRVVGDEDDRPS